MRFRPGARLDPSQVEDRRGAGGGFGGGPSRSAAAGSASSGSSSTCCSRSSAAAAAATSARSTASPPARADAVESLGTSCRTGADANTRQDCRIVGDVNSVQAYWARLVPGARQDATRRPTTVFFTGSTEHRLRHGDDRRRPVLLPGRQEGLHRPRLLRGAARPVRRAGRPVRRGVRDRARVRPPRPGPARRPRARRLDRARESRSVRTELQADCYAGVWARNAVATGYIVDLTHADIADGLDAAAAVGDDRIQQETQGRVEPGDLDARLVGRAPEVVPARLPARRADAAATRSAARCKLACVSDEGGRYERDRRCCGIDSRPAGAGRGAPACGRAGAPPGSNRTHVRPLVRRRRRALVRDLRRRTASTSGRASSLCRGWHGAGSARAASPTCRRSKRGCARPAGSPPASPRPGDIAVFDWDGGVPDHVGIVDPAAAATSSRPSRATPPSATTRTAAR